MIKGIARESLRSGTIIYERQLRPAEKPHAPWISRVTGQLLAAYQALESECRQTPLADGKTINQAGVSVAVAWHFTQQMLPEVVAASAFPALQQFSAKAEALQAFAAAPHGAGTYRQTG